MYEETATLTHAWTHWVCDARRVSAKTTDGRAINGALIAVQVDDEAPGGSQLRATIRTDDASGAVEAVFQSELVTMRGPGRQSTRASADAEQRRAKRTPQLVEVKPGESVAAVLAAALGDDSLAAALGAQPSAAEPVVDPVADYIDGYRDAYGEEPPGIPYEIAVAVEVEELAPEAVLAAFTAPAVEPATEEAPAAPEAATIEYACDTPGCENTVTLADFPAKGELVFCSACEGASVHTAEVRASARSKRTKATATATPTATVTIGYPKAKQTRKPAGAKAKAGK